ncbi:Permeases of the drug/metabolite transporter (DMT) superfamily [Thermococcus nautili]|uniref:DMT family transporter n=1 Tax=Thermococcus nautili TaxID=195522 RepID=UPI0025523359|nr:DMT family transporter [Thermococcus nautili]CAI1492499.1 Permeases of the drug/metabolite transporter (DMT) superfamily [Thermococcus nautili]
MNRGKVQIALAMLIWGSVGIFGRLSGLSGLGVAFARVSLGALVLLPLLSLRGKLRNALGELRKRPYHMLALGTALALNWVFLFTAFNYTSIANAVLVYYTAPVLATLISWRFLNERLDAGKVLSLAIAFTGLLLIASSQRISLSDRDFTGIVFAFLGALFYALIPNLGRFLRGVDGESLTFLQLAIASIVLIPFVAVENVGSPVWWAIAVLVLLHTVFALYLYMDGLKKVEVKDASLLSYLDPLSAIVYAFLVFGEVPGVRTVIGGALILLASAIDLARGS